MRGNKFTDEQKILILKEFDSGVPLKELCRKHAVSDATIYNWKRKLGGMEVQDAKRMRQLEDENKRLKRLVADQALDLCALRDIVSGKL